MTDVSAVLANYPPDCRPKHVDALGSAGGMSGAQFWRVTLPRGKLAVRRSPDLAHRHLVLRRWPAEFQSADCLSFIHGVLRHAADRGIRFLPLPFTTLTGETFVSHGGNLWELAPWMPGTADYERSPSVEKLQSAMRALAQLHLAVADYKFTPANANSPAPVRHLTRLRDLQRDTSIQELAGSINNSVWPELAPLARQFVAALPRAIPLAIARLELLAAVPFMLQPCLRDIWHDHVLFTGNEVTGLVDFGAIEFDTPATDIARLLGSFVTSPRLPRGEVQAEASATAALDRARTWQEGLAAYQAVRTLSPDEIRAAHALDVSSPILAGCSWVRWVYIDGRRFDDPQQVLARFQRICAAVA